ncbi:MAG: YveK family protein [Chloroflexota bacterium]
MSLTDYLRILLRHGWIVIALALIAGGTAFFVSRQETPVYRASQVVLIQPSRPDLGLAEASVRTINSLAVYLDSELRAQEIIEELQLDMTPGELMSRVSIAPDQLRLTIQIDVNSTDPGEAARIARAWGQTLVDYREDRNQLVRREDRVDALLPDAPRVGQFSPRPTFNGIAGALLGLLVGGVIVFVLEYLESGLIRRREDLERNTQLAVLASIPAQEG